MKAAFVRAGDSLNLYYNGTSYTFPKKSPYYKELMNVLNSDDHSTIPDLIKKDQDLNTYSGGDAIVSGTEVLVDNLPVKGLIKSRMLEFMQEGLPVEPLIAFVRRVRKNPSFSAQERLYECLEHNHHPILSDGRFLAYKAVRDNFLDIHSGTYDNSPGKVLTMPRQEVDDNHQKTCSAGLHVSSYSYALGFMRHNGKLVNIAVDPADIVAIPYDYNNQKMRTCRYEVLCENTEQEVKDRILHLKKEYEQFQQNPYSYEDNYWDVSYDDNDDEDEDEDRFYY